MYICIYIIYHLPINRLLRFAADAGSQKSPPHKPVTAFCCRSRVTKIAPPKKIAQTHCVVGLAGQECRVPGCRCRGRPNSKQG